YPEADENAVSSHLPRAGDVGSYVFLLPVRQQLPIAAVLRDPDLFFDHFPVVKPFRFSRLVRGNVHFQPLHGAVQLPPAGPADGPGGGQLPFMLSPAFECRPPHPSASLLLSLPCTLCDAAGRGDLPGAGVNRPPGTRSSVRRGPDRNGSGK